MTEFASGGAQGAGPKGAQVRTMDSGAASGSRVLIAIALLLLVLYGAALTVVASSIPSVTQSGQQVVAWLRGHRVGVLWSVWIGTVSVFLLAWMTAILRRMLPAVYRDLFLIGAIVLCASNAIQSWFLAGLALHADRLDPAIARTVLDVVSFWGPVLTGATTCMIAPVAWLGLRREAGIPLWLGILGAIAFVEQAIETITIFGTSGFTEPGGAMNMQLGAGLTMLWLFSFAFWAGLKGRTQ